MIPDHDFSDYEEYKDLETDAQEMFKSCKSTRLIHPLSLSLSCFFFLTVLIYT